MYRISLAIFTLFLFAHVRTTGAQSCDGTLSFSNPGITYVGEVSGNDRVRIDWIANPAGSCCENVVTDSSFEIHVTLQRAVTKDRKTLTVPSSARTVNVDFRRNALETNPKSIEATITLKKVYHVQSGGKAEATLNQATMKVENLTFGASPPDPACKLPVTIGNILYNGRASGDDVFNVLWSFGPTPTCSCAPPVNNLRINFRVMRANGRTDSGSSTPSPTATSSIIHVGRGVLDQNPVNIEAFLVAMNDRTLTKTVTKTITIP